QRPAVRHLYGLRGAVVDNDELGAGWQLTLERLDGGSEEVRSVQRGDADADVRGLLGVVVPRWCRQVGLRDVADSVDHDLGHWRTSMNRQCAESEGLEPPRAFAPAAFEAVSSTNRALSSDARPPPTDRPDGRGGYFDRLLPSATEAPARERRGGRSQGPALCCVGGSARTRAAGLSGLVDRLQ